MNNIIIGQYIPGTSYLYKMDPRSKIIALIILMVTTFIFESIFEIIIMLAIVLFILKLGGIEVGRIAKGLRPIMVLLLFTFTFQILFVSTGNLLFKTVLHFSIYNILIAASIFVLYFLTRKHIKFRVFYFLLTVVAIITVFSLLQLGNVFSTSTLSIYSGGVSGAFFIMFRLIIIVTLSTILTLTTKPTDLTLGLEKLLKPMKYIGVSSEEIALIISIALRYIPTLLDEANKIMLAQASRGVDFAEGKLKDKIMQIISLLVPMFIISFKRSDELANAMEARNFIPGQKRTRLHILTWGRNDTAVVVVSTLTLVASIVLLFI